MSVDQRNELPDDVRARSYDRYRKLTPWVDESISRLMHAEPVQAATENAKPATEKQDAKKPDNCSTRLIDIGGEGQTLFHDERGDGYVRVDSDGVQKTFKLKGRDFRRWIAGRYWQQYRNAANNEALQNALNVLEAKANHEGQEIELHNRFAVAGDSIFIDLCDDKWRAVCVSKEGWKIVPCPVLFRRYVHQKALPTPERGGSLDGLDGFMNIKSADDRTLVRAWLVASVMESVPRPALTFHGPQGSAKTTGGRVLRRLIDPSISECLGFPKDDTELAQLLDHHAVPLLDNVRKVGDQAADTLCRAVTGGAFSKRELFSDAEDVIFRFRRALILNGINIPTHAPDLLDRMQLIELERVPAKERLTERQFWSEFDAELPALFGALLDSVSIMLRTQFNAPELPRMADFAELGARWAEGSGIGGEEFLEMYSDNVSRQIEEALESDSVGCAIRELAKVGRFEGTPSALLKRLNERRNGEAAPSDWPKRAESLGKRIKVLQTTLHDSGIEIVHGKKDGARWLAVNRREQPSQPSQPSQSYGNGRLDDKDGSFPDLSAGGEGRTEEAEI